MTLLGVEKLSIEFGGIHAVKDVSFDVDDGEIVALIGSNGAGKTTVFNLLSRVYDPSAGRIIFKDIDVTRVPGHRMAHLGLARTFQNIELFGGATVRANLLLGCEVRRRTNVFEEMIFSPRVARQEATFKQKVTEIISFLNLSMYQDALVSAIPYGIRKVVELGRALAIEPALLLLDEPSSGLDDHETEVMARWIQDIRDQLNITVLIIEHDMNLVAAVSDRVIAMNAGRILTIGSIDEVRRNPEVITAYLGEHADEQTSLLS